MSKWGGAQVRGGKDRVRVRADRKKGRVAEVQQARETHHDVEADRHQHVDAAVSGQSDQIIAVAVGGELDGDREENGGEEHHRVRDCVGIPDVRANVVASRGHFSGTRIPRRPVGLNTSTKIRIEKMSTCVQATVKYPSEIAAMIPMRSPPSAAPGMFPMPPKTAAVNATSPY